MLPQKNEYYIEVSTIFNSDTRRQYTVHRGKPDVLSDKHVALLGPYDASNKYEALANALDALNEYRKYYIAVQKALRNILNHHSSSTEIADIPRQMLQSLLTGGI
jgi:hypothetical protein